MSEVDALSDLTWEPWEPKQLGLALDGINLHWYIVGGWALDLWSGAQSRPHEDIEFCVLRPDLWAVQARFPELTFYAALSGALILMDEQNVQEAQQFWALDRQAMRWRFDVMIEPGTQDTWSYNRDPSFTMPRADMVRWAGTIPFLNPAAVLLFKAKHRRPKDEADFDRVVEALVPEDRAWLQRALQRFHPGHDWSDRL